MRRMTFRRRLSEYLKERFNKHEDGEAGLLSGASPAALQPARRMSWLASERARMCLSLPTQSGLVRCPIACVHASVPTAGWGGIPSKLAVSGLRGIVLGLVRSTSRVRTYATKKRRFSGMIPSQRLKGRFRGLCSLSFRTNRVQLAYPSTIRGVVRWRSMPRRVA